MRFAFTSKAAARARIQRHYSEKDLGVFSKNLWRLPKARKSRGISFFAVPGIMLSGISRMLWPLTQMLLSSF
jgi:hypothetical protein